MHTRELWHRILLIFRRDRAERELREEIALHLQLRAGAHLCPPAVSVRRFF